jgi:hypothetical protein
MSGKNWVFTYYFGGASAVKEIILSPLMTSIPKTLLISFSGAPNSKI